MGDNKYQHGKIYKVVDHAYEKMYIGSTIQTLSNRMSEHRGHYKNWKDGLRHKLSLFDIFDEYGTDNCRIELLEAFPCKNKDELRQREGFHIQHNQCANKVVAGRSKKQWEEDNKERISVKQKEKYEANKEQYLSRNKNYRQTHAEEIRQQSMKYRNENKENINKRKKQYYLENHDEIRAKQLAYRTTHKEQIKEVDKKYQETNKAKIAERRNTKVACQVWGNTYTQCNKTRHERSTFHQHALAQSTIHNSNENNNIIEI